MSVRESFLRRRKSGIGGSDAAAIMGLSRYRTALDVYRDKTSDEVKDESNDILELASHLEDYTARKWAGLTGYGIQRANIEIIHPDHPFLKGNIDRKIINAAPGEGVGILECKALSTYNFRNVEMRGLPDEYIIQMQFYFAVSGIKWGAFAILNRDCGRLLMFRAEPDGELMEKIVTSCVAFWTQCVIPRIQPVEAEPERVSIPKYDGKLSDLSADDDFAALCADYDELKAMANEASELVDQAAGRIKDHLGEIQAAECSGYRVYYATGKPRVTLDSTRLKKDLPDVYEKYAKTGEASRSFRFYQLNKQG